MLIGAVGVGKTLLFNQFLSSSEDREANGNNLGALINSTRNLVVDNEEYLLELLECEEFGYVSNFYSKCQLYWFIILSHINIHSLSCFIPHYLF